MSDDLFSDDNLCSVGYAALAFGVPEARLADWRSTGDGPDYTVIEGRVWYPQRRLYQWMESRFQANLLISRVRHAA